MPVRLVKETTLRPGSGALSVEGGRASKRDPKTLVSVGTLPCGRLATRNKKGGHSAESPPRPRAQGRRGETLSTHSPLCASREGGAKTASPARPPLQSPPPSRSNLGFSFVLPAAARARNRPPGPPATGAPAACAAGPRLLMLLFAAPEENPRPGSRYRRCCPSRGRRCEDVATADVHIQPQLHFVLLTVAGALEKWETV